MKLAWTLLPLGIACSTSSGGNSVFSPPNIPPPPTVTPPVIACTQPDAGCGDAAQCDAGLWFDPCTLPPAVCADSHWAAYFDDGACVDGRCELVTKYHYCEQGCSNGDCISNWSTAVMPRGY